MKDIPNGNAVVAWYAAWGDWLRPMKKNEIEDIVGRPPMSPPIPLEYFLAAYVAEPTPAPPTRNAKTTWAMNGSATRESAMSGRVLLGLVCFSDFYRAFENLRFEIFCEGPKAY